MLPIDSVLWITSVKWLEVIFRKKIYSRGNLQKTMRFKGKKKKRKVKSVFTYRFFRNL